jgi:hypothetical protein
VSPNCTIKDFWGEISAFDKLWYLALGFSKNSFVHGHFERDESSSPPSDFWSIVETFVAHGAEPKRSLLWRPRQKTLLRRMLEEHSQFDEDRISNLLLRSDFFFCPTGRRIESLKVWTRSGLRRMKLFPNNRRLFMGVLDEHVDNPDSYIIITFQDVVEHVLPENAERILSLLKRKSSGKKTLSWEGHKKELPGVYGQTWTRHYDGLHWQSGVILSKRLPTQKFRYD